MQTKANQVASETEKKTTTETVGCGFAGAVHDLLAIGRATPFDEVIMVLIEASVLRVVIESYCCKP